MLHFQGLVLQEKEVGHIGYTLEADVEAPAPFKLSVLPDHVLNPPLLVHAPIRICGTAMGPKLQGQATVTSLGTLGVSSHVQPSFIFSGMTVQCVGMRLPGLDFGSLSTY